MDTENKFDAPWSVSLKVMTTASVSILAGLPLLGLSTGPTENLVWILAMIALPLLILFIAIFFVIRGYDLTSQTLCVQRLGWHNELNLANLLSVERDPMAMNGSIRLFGNGGLFCFAGKFRNQKLGVYRIFATAPELSVILKFTDQTIVVTPDNPERFVNALKNIISAKK